MLKWLGMWLVVVLVVTGLAGPALELAVEAESHARNLRIGVVDSNRRGSGGSSSFFATSVPEPPPRPGPGHVLAPMCHSRSTGVV